MTLSRVFNLFCIFRIGAWCQQICSWIVQSQPRADLTGLRVANLVPISLGKRRRRNNSDNN